jgi:hypothetical protein
MVFNGVLAFTVRYQKWQIQGMAAFTVFMLAYNACDGSYVAFLFLN